MDVRQNLQLYKDMIQCAGPLYMWAYNDCGRLVYSNCPEEEVLAQVFELFGCKKRLYDHLLPDTPMQVASSIGLQWCAAAETDGGKVKMVYLIGPYFTENTVLRNMELAMRQLQNLNLSVETTMQIEKALKALPTLATNIMNHYAIMLNYCVTGVQKNTFDIHNVFSVIVIYAVGGCILSGIFSVGETKSLETLSAKIHGYGSVIGFLLLTLAPLFVGLYFFKVSNGLLGILSLICFIFAIVFFALFVMADKPNYRGTIIAFEGLWQRLSLLSMYLPIAALCIFQK